MGLTEGLERPHVRRIIVQSVAGAAAVALVFLAIGKFILLLLGIAVADFIIAGGRCSSSFRSEICLPF
jgi:small neutral amino acid transporter SnatA (MarC family)